MAIKSTSLGMFKQEKYKKIRLNDKNETLAGHLSPATTDGLANNAEEVLSFFHVPSESDVFFKAFITTFNENYNCDWTPDTVFGRTDPIYTFKNTSRTITLGWKIPAETISEAYENLARVQTLSRFLYPSYASLQGNVNTLSQSPLVRLKVMNLVQKSGAGGLVSNSPEALLERYISNNNPAEGLLGVITGMSVNHNLENQEAGVVQVATNTILPKLIEVNIDFSVIHESVLGWDDSTGTTSFMDESFPYNANMEMEFDGNPPVSYEQKIERRKNNERARLVQEQARQNALARGYNGMFGNATVRKDLKTLRRLKDKIDAGEKLSDRQKRNFDYLLSAQTGHINESGIGTEELDNRTEAFLEAID